MKHNSRIASLFVLVALSAVGIRAQDAKKHDHDHDHNRGQDQGPGHSPQQTKWKMVGEFGIGAATDKVVATGIEYMSGFIAAGVADGEHEHWCQRFFMTSETLAAVPLRFRFLRDATETGRMREPLLLLDYEKEIRFDEMFTGMRPQALGGDALVVMRMNMCPVKRPDGGYRLNFGGKNIFGEHPTDNPLLTTFTEIRAEAKNERLMALLRRMPIHGSFDFRTVMSSRENNEILGLFGPRAALVAGSVSLLGRRPALDLYSAMQPRDGVVGQYLDQRPGHARLLGALNFEPDIVLTADLGKQLPRSLLTLVKAARQGSDIKEVFEPLLDLLESWTGEVNLIATGVAPPAQLDLNRDGNTSARFASLFERFGKSLEGTILFGVEAGSAVEVVDSLETFLASESARKSEFAFETLEEDGKRAFRIGGRAARDIGVKHVALGAGNRIVVISIADTLARSFERLDGVMQKRGKVPMPKKLGMVQGPLKIWVQEDVLRYVGVWYRTMRGFLAGSSVENRADWIQDKLERDLLSENLAASLSWTKKYGVMLRVLF